MLPGIVKDPDATRSSAVDIALLVNFHAVWVSRLLTGHSAKDPVRGQRQQPRRFYIEGSNVTTAGIIDVQDLLVWGKAQAIGENKIPYQQVNRFSIRRDTIDPAEVQFGFDATHPWIGEIDTAVGFHHHIIRSIQVSAVILVRHHGDAAIQLDAGHAASPTFAGYQPPLSIAGQ